MELSAALSTSVQLELLPKSTIAVHVLVLQDDGGVPSAAITCASLALADASIHLYGLVAASSCALLPQPPGASSSGSGKVALDCSAEEVSQSLGELTVACMPALDQMTLMRHEGLMPAETLTEAMQLALSGCRLLQDQMSAALKTKMREEVSSATVSSSTSKRLEDASKGDTQPAPGKPGGKRPRAESA